MLTGVNRVVCMIQHISPGRDLDYADPAQHLVTTGSDLHDLDYLNGLSYVSKRMLQVKDSLRQRCCRRGDRPRFVTYLD